MTLGEKGTYTVSVDRIDNSKGYVKGNIALCCWIVNNMKTDMTMDEFLGIVKDIHQKFHQNPEP